MTGFASVAGEDCLVPCSYSQKTPETIPMVVKPCLYWSIPRCQKLSIRGPGEIVRCYETKELNACVVLTCICGCDKTQTISKHLNLLWIFSIRNNTVTFALSQGCASLNLLLFLKWRCELSEIVHPVSFTLLILHFYTHSIAENTQDATVQVQ